MTPTSRSLILCAALLAGCSDDSSIAPRTTLGEDGVTASITSITDVPLFAGQSPAVGAQVQVRNLANAAISVDPCSGFIEARLPSSQTWTNIGFATVGLCPIPARLLAPRESAELGASGSADEFRALAGSDSRTMLIRAGFAVRTGTESFLVRSAEYSVTRP